MGRVKTKFPKNGFSPFTSSFTLFFPTDGCSGVDVYYQLGLTWLLNDIKRGRGIMFDG